MQQCIMICNANTYMQYFISGLSADQRSRKTFSLQRNIHMPLGNTGQISTNMGPYIIK